MKHGKQVKDKPVWACPWYGARGLIRPSETALRCDQTAVNRVVLLMKHNLFFAFIAFAIGFGVSLTSVEAQGSKLLRNSDEPANLPPAEFAGRQFVDARGCVYVRSGYAGRVTWVPRLASPKRRVHLCSKDFPPTFPNAVVAEAKTERPKRLAGLFSGRKDRKPKPEAAPVIKEQDVAIVAPQPEPPIVPRAEIRPLEVVPAAPEPDVGAIVPNAEELIQPGVETTAPVGLSVAQQRRLAREARAAERKAAREARAQARAQAAAERDAARAQAVAEKQADQAALQTARAEAEAQRQAEREASQLAQQQKEAARAAERQARAAEEAAEQDRLAAQRAAEQAAAEEQRKLAALSVEIPRGIFVRVGSFDDPDKAENTRTTFRRSGHSGYAALEDGYTVVYVGPFRTEGAAKAAFYQARGSGFPNARIITR